ncbi:MAG: S9 family peptidase [Chloroflexi bacterium]|nr:S9 family peptidase [Chloroflexota bacterium]
MGTGKIIHIPSVLLVLALVLAACSSALPPATPLAPAPVVAVPATATPLPTTTPTVALTATPAPNPLTIASMRQREYPGSDITIEQTLANGSNYKRYLAAYRSDGLKIYALLTVPNGTKPKTGWPVVIFNHGYIPPAQYKTTERYIAYVDAFARSGYIVVKSDYRGHGNSEGAARGGYGTPDYTVDVLNAVAAMVKYKDADPNRIGMWGHSMGGQATLRAMVVSNQIKAGVIWAGVVASYGDLISRWRPTTTPVAIPSAARRWRQELIAQYGTPEENPLFWNSISPNAFLNDLSGPLQLHHGTSDSSVPFAFSETLNQQVIAAGRTVEFYSYRGDDHNLSKNLTTALQRSVAFFDKYVKR